MANVAPESESDPTLLGEDILGLQPWAIESSRDSTGGENKADLSDGFFAILQSLSAELGYKLRKKREDIVPEEPLKPVLAHGFEKVDTARVELIDLGRKYITDHLTNHAKSEKDSGALNTVAGKQAFCSYVKLKLQEYGMTIILPDTNAPCNIYAINDNYGGKFVLENKASKKRCNTTRDILDLIPFRLVPILDS